VTSKHHRFEYQAVVDFYRELENFSTKHFTNHHLVPNENFHCQTPLKNAEFDLFGFGSEKSQLAYLGANADWLIVTVLQACKIRSTKIGFY